MRQILVLFHHIHHEGKKHKVHHCGGNHRELNYKIEHCNCGKHSIDREEAEGHDFNNNVVKVKFFERCSNGGWHIESGRIIK